MVLDFVPQRQLEKAKMSPILLTTNTDYQEVGTNAYG